jgi:hypothetical protein
MRDRHSRAWWGDAPTGHALRLTTVAVCCGAMLGATAWKARADEGGVSFWLPGQYGSFAAVAPSPGWSLPLVFYNYGGSVSAGKLLPRGHLVSAGLSASYDGFFIVPTYTPDTTVLGARPSFSLAFAPWPPTWKNCDNSNWTAARRF